MIPGNELRDPGHGSAPCEWARRPTPPPHPEPDRMPIAPRRVAGAALAVLATLTAGACNNKRVVRIDPASVTDLSGRWNDADSRLVASALVEQALGAPWLGRAAAARGGRPPAVVVDGFRNA